MNNKEIPRDTWEGCTFAVIVPMTISVIHAYSIKETSQGISASENKAFPRNEKDFNVIFPSELEDPSKCIFTLPRTTWNIYKTDLFIK